MFASLFAKTQAQPQRNYSRLVIISDFHYPCKNMVPPKERLTGGTWTWLSLQGTWSSATAMLPNTAWCASSSMD